ncbi:MAG TPA: type VI secretion system baseplate subunit TssE [Caulobacteraceae bacterium]|nr:type VI secretion system baseplate subunit TssE [Caulobacteraceae bacterium]
MAPRINPTLFDKLAGGSDLFSAADSASDGRRGETARDGLRRYSAPEVEQYNEAALRNSVRRDLAWLINTVNFEATVDLDPYPHVKTSVINYGVADMTGKALTKRMVHDRASRLREAILAFEPRLAPSTLSVTAEGYGLRENALTYVIHGDVTSAVHALPVRFATDVEVDTGAATVRD